jgi:hypothetical protein
MLCWVSISKSSEVRRSNKGMLGFRKDYGENNYSQYLRRLNLRTKKSQLFHAKFAQIKTSN